MHFDDNRQVDPTDLRVEAGSGTALELLFQGRKMPEILLVSLTAGRANEHSGGRGHVQLSMVVHGTEGNGGARAPWGRSLLERCHKACTTPQSAGCRHCRGEPRD